MQKQLLMLASGGVAMLCLAPQLLGAEDGASQLQAVTTPWVFSNVNDTVPVVPRTASPKSVAPQPEVQPAPFSEDEARTQYRPLIEEISKNYGVDPDLIDALMKTESNYNRLAVSSKGARGLMQLIPETGRRFGVQNFFDPRENIEGGVRYVRFLLDMFHGNVDLALAGYNAGENLVARLGKIPPIQETRNYVRKIRAVYTKPTSRTFAMSAVPAAVPLPKPAEPVTRADAAKPVKPVKNETEAIAPISRRVDERGVTHFSNVESSN